MFLFIYLVKNFIFLFIMEIFTKLELLIYFHTKHLWHPFYFENGMLLLLVIVFSLFVIISTNPIHSILFLVLVFLITSVVFIYSGVFFLGMVLVIVYLGAVCVLFLFVIMMLNIKVLELKRKINFLPYLFVLFLVFYLVRLKGVNSNLFENPKTGESVNEILKNDEILLANSKYKIINLLVGNNFEKKNENELFTSLDFKFKAFEKYLLLFGPDIILDKFENDEIKTKDFINDILLKKDIIKLQDFINLLIFRKKKEETDYYRKKIVIDLGKTLIYNPDVEKQIKPLISMAQLGTALYSFCVLQFISAGIVLLIAMIGSIFLTLELDKDSKKQFFFSQINRTKYKF